jgi:hypothetical protein
MEGKLREYRAWQVWDEAVGPQVAARARPVRIREGVLEVRVDSPAWMQQLQLLKPKILARLNERLGGEVIRDLFWRRGRTEPEAVEAPARSQAPAWRTATLTEEELGRVEAALAPLTDPELRQQLRAVLIRQAKLDRTRDDQSKS